MLFLFKIAPAAIVLFLCSASLSAQWAVTAAGGEASGPGGSMSYSCGIVAFTHHSENNFALSQGVHHGFEIPQFSVNTTTANVHNFEAYPNPTVNNFTIKKDNLISNHLDVYIFSTAGKLLMHDILFDENTAFSLNGFSNGTYLVAISSGGVVLKYFKIIKQH